ncbi:hypothetical protein KVR01_003641 [Diaporthe batatas]|uniref:uncharacterized protein n=1 Tax=Diaporthe batatas TaxID=748121 RepID=UPI001D04A79D|nr:uncharacterized protein KVR01_003641 [Diaporthe batatas]KAG8167952.1 hypothetical protein KVR01_003641 [Diaporthe batatas]
MQSKHGFKCQLECVKAKADILGGRMSWNNENFPSDIVSWLVKAVHDKDLSAAPTPEALQNDFRLFLLADRLVDPRCQMLRSLSLQKCGSTDKAARGTRKSKSSHFWIIVAETLQLKPTVLVAGSREDLAAGLLIKQVHISGNTNFLVLVHNIQRDLRLAGGTLVYT